MESGKTFTLRRPWYSSLFFLGLSTSLPEKIFQHCCLRQPFSKQTLSCYKQVNKLHVSNVVTLQGPQAHSQHAMWNVSTDRDGFIEGPKKEAFSIWASPWECCGVWKSRVNTWTPFLLAPMLTKAPTLQLQPQKANKKLWNYNILLLGSQPHLTAALRMAPSTKVKPHTASGPALPRAEHVPWILAAAEVHEWTSTILASFCTDSLQDSGLHPYDGYSNP